MAQQPSLFEGLSLAQGAQGELRAAIARLTEQVPVKLDPTLKAPPIGDVERRACALGIPRVLGVDEAGRGPWAGPVVAAAVLFPPLRELPAELSLLNDSKQLSEEQRQGLLRPIARHALAFGVGHVSAQQIDEQNILQATFSAMRQALCTLKRRYHSSGGSLEGGSLALIDGKQRLPVTGGEPWLSALIQHPLVGGDARSWSVAAASVVAKVTRDERMKAYARRYPGYGFERHKGYGTAQHKAALKALGPSPVHRLSYKPIKALLEDR